MFYNSHEGLRTLCLKNMNDGCSKIKYILFYRKTLQVVYAAPLLKFYNNLKERSLSEVVANTDSV